MHFQFCCKKLKFNQINKFPEIYTPHFGIFAPCFGTPDIAIWKFSYARPVVDTILLTHD